jgi:hypothetical protein
MSVHLIFLLLNLHSDLFYQINFTIRNSKDNILDMHFLWTASLRSSLSNRFLVLKRLQSTQAATQNPKTFFTYGKGGYYFLDRIDPNESVRTFDRVCHKN